MEALGSLVPFLLIALVFWLLLIRPQRRRAMELDRIQRGLTPGDQVLRGSGIVATVADIPSEGEFLGVEVSPGVRIRVARGAVARILESSAPATTDRDIDPPTTDLTKH